MSRRCGLAAAGALLFGGTAANAATAAPHAAVCKGAAASLSADQCTAFRADMKSVRAQRDAIFAKYGITAPAKGKHLDRSQLAGLSKDQRTALRADLAAHRAAKAAVFAKYGLTLPARHTHAGATHG